MKLSEKIVKLRKENGFSQEDLAQRLAVSRQAVSRWETGSALPDAENLLQLSRLFSVSADYLLNDDWQEPKPPIEQPMIPRPVSREEKELQFQTRAAIFMTVFGLAGNFMLYIASRFVEVMIPRKVIQNGMPMIEYSSGYTDHSYRYFILEYDLEILAAVLWTFFARGIVLFVINSILRRRRKKRLQ